MRKTECPPIAFFYNYSIVVVALLARVQFVRKRTNEKRARGTNLGEMVRRRERPILDIPCPLGYNNIK
jgi:hypothetical protein